MIVWHFPHSALYRLVRVMVNHLLKLVKAWVNYRRERYLDRALRPTLISREGSSNPREPPLGLSIKEPHYQIVIADFHGLNVIVGADSPRGLDLDFHALPGPCESVKPDTVRLRQAEVFNEGGLPDKANLRALAYVTIGVIGSPNRLTRVGVADRGEPGFLAELGGNRNFNFQGLTFLPRTDTLGIFPGTSTTRRYNSVENRRHSQPSFSQIEYECWQSSQKGLGLPFHVREPAQFGVSVICDSSRKF